MKKPKPIKITGTIRETLREVINMENEIPILPVGEANESLEK